MRRAEVEAGEEEHDDVLSLLLQARHDDGSPMSDEELRDELVTVLGAGHETTATGAGLGDGAAAAHAARAGAAARVDRGRRGRLPRRDGQRDAARAAGDRRRRPQADRAGRDRRLRAAGRDLRDAGDRRPALPRGPLPRARGVPARALPRRQGRQLRLDPLRRRRAPLHRRRLRRIRDAGRSCATILERADLSAPDPKPEKVKVRNITLAPGRGTRVRLDRPLR